MPTTMQFLITLSFDGHIDDEDLARGAFRLQLHADLADLLLNGHIDREPGSGPWGWLHASLDRVQVHTIVDELDSDTAPVPTEALPDLHLEQQELDTLVELLSDVARGDSVVGRSYDAMLVRRAVARKAARHFRALQSPESLGVTA